MKQACWQTGSQRKRLPAKKARSSGKHSCTWLIFCSIPLQYHLSYSMCKHPFLLDNFVTASYCRPGDVFDRGQIGFCCILNVILNVVTHESITETALFFCFFPFVPALTANRTLSEGLTYECRFWVTLHYHCYCCDRRFFPLNAFN